MPSEGVTRAIAATIEELNSGLLADEPLAVDPDGVLFGPDGRLGSLETVNFVIVLDEKLQAELTAAPSVAEHLAAADDVELPPTLGAFAEFVERLMRAGDG